MNKNLSSNKADIYQFIRLSLLRSDQLDLILPQIIQSLTQQHENKRTVEEIQDMAKKHILSEQYLAQFIPIIEDHFSSEEIRKLVQFYEDETINKYFKNGKTIAPAVYSTFTDAIKEVLSPGYLPEADGKTS